MLRSYQLFWIYFVGLFFVTSVIGGGYGFFALKRLTINKAIADLKIQLHLAQYWLKQQKQPWHFKNLKHLSKTLGRITIVDAKGQVAADTNYDIKNMDNYIERPEIMQAKKFGQGVDIRLSSKSKQNTLFVAERFKVSHKIYYVSAAIEMSVVLDQFYRICKAVLAYFAFLWLLSLVVGWFLRVKIKRQTSEILWFLDQILNKKYDFTLQKINNKDFLEIARSLNVVADKLQEREHKLKKRNQQLEFALKQKEWIFSALSHEFKNPIATISGFSQAIRELKLPNKQLDHFNDKIYNNTQRLSALLDRLIFFIKLENGSVLAQCSFVNLTTLCQTICDTMTQVKKRKITFECKDNVIVYADVQLLELCLINLIENAVKYSDKKVRVCLNRQWFKVIDEGRGIKETDIKKITQRFYRVKKNHWDNSMGLGLSIVSHILELHHLKLYIKSQYKKGSTFGFDISSVYLEAEDF